MDKSLASKPRVCFEVEKVIGFTSEGNVRSYQVQWAPAWVSSFHLVGCEHLIKDFFIRQQSQVNDLKTQDTRPCVSQEQDVQEIQIQNESEAECPSKGTQDNNCESRDEPPMVVSVEPSIEIDFDLPADPSGFNVEVKEEGDINSDIQNLDIQSLPNFSSAEENQENSIIHSTTEHLFTTSPIKLEDSESESQPDMTDSYSSTQYLNNTAATYASFTWDTSHNTDGPISMAHVNPTTQHKSTRDMKPQQGLRSTKPRPKAANKYPCSVCDKRLPSKSQLEIHFRIHTGDKPFKCSYCPKAFAHSSNLKKHHRTHSGEKPYHCEICGKSFTESTHLKRHSLTHSAAAEGPYVCPRCGVVCAHSAELEQHVLTSQCNGYV